MKISVITPVFNSDQTIERCLVSLHSQTINFEHIIVDGGSIDNTEKIINSRIRQQDIYLREKDEGIYDAINKGIRLATGDIIAILNSDDYYLHNQALELIFNAFEHGSEIVYGGIFYTLKSGEQGSTWLPTNYPGSGSFLKGWHPPHPSFFTLKRCYEQSGYYNIELKVSADFELMLRFFEKEHFKSTRLDKILVGMDPNGYSSRLSSIFTGMTNIYKSFKLNGMSIGPSYYINRYFKKLTERKLSIFKKS